MRDKTSARARPGLSLAASVPVRQPVRWRRRLAALTAVTLMTAGLPASALAQPAKPSPTRSHPNPSPATRVWTVSRKATPDRTPFCEVAMRGRNPEAGGDYAIRFRFKHGAQTDVILTYAAPFLQDVDKIVLAYDENRFAALAVQHSRRDGGRTIAKTVDADPFNRLLLNRFDQAAPSKLILEAGGRVFQAPVQGWSAVIDKLEACRVSVRAPPYQPSS